MLPIVPKAVNTRVTNKPNIRNVSRTIPIMVVPRPATIEKAESSIKTVIKSAPIINVSDNIKPTVIPIEFNPPITVPYHGPLIDISLKINS